MTTPESQIGITMNSLGWEEREFKKLIRGFYELEDYGTIVKNSLQESNPFLFAFLYRGRPETPIASWSFYEAGVAYGMNVISDSKKEALVTPEDIGKLKLMLFSHRTEIGGMSFFDLDWYIEKLEATEPALHGYLSTKTEMFESSSQSFDFDAGILYGSMAYCVKANNDVFFDQLHDVA